MSRVIPIVFIQVTDPVAQGFVGSLARPGGNVTGFAHWEASMGGKWLDLLMEVAPRLERVTVIFNPESAPYFGIFQGSMQAVAGRFAVKLTTTHIRNTLEMENAVTLAGRERNSGLVVLPDVFTIQRRKRITELAAKLGLPPIYSFSYFAEDGGLISYGIDIPDIWRRSAPYVDRVLRGEKPADLPIEQPTKFELVINLRAAKVLGLQIPATLLALANEVIE
jgi:putative ABC transport system substrate-binding protein